jgi:cytochrome P450
LKQAFAPTHFRDEETHNMLEFNPYDRDYGADPYPLYERLREEAPVFHNPEMRFWALSRYDDVVAAHRDAATFSSAGGVTIEGAEASMPLLIVKDHPEHNWAKSLVTKLFSRPRMAALDIFMRRRAGELIEAAAEKCGPDGEFNFVSEFTVQLPLEVISELLGIPPALRQEIHHLSNIAISRGEDRDESVSTTATRRNMEIYLLLARERRANPRDDIISMVIAQEVEDENGVKHSLSDEEIAVRFGEMSFAGHETVAKAIPNGAMAFHRFPDQRSKLTRNRGLLPNAVEEILRYDPPSQLQGRTTTRDVTLHGVTIPVGSKTMLVTGSATRDPRAFEEPAAFNIERKLDNRSIFFGYGVHKCLGIHLARQELAIAFDELFNRFPNWEVDPTRITRSILSNVRGVDSLPIRLGKHA